MKKLTSMATVLALVLGGSAYAAEALHEGSTEFGVQGKVEFESAVGTDISVSLRAGHFVADGIQVGAFGSFADNDVDTRWGVGVFGEYNLLTGGAVVPFVGISGAYNRSEPSGLKNTDAFVLGAEAGGKYFLTANTALTLSYLFELSSDDIFVDDDQLEDTNHSILLGLRFYF